MNISTGSDTTSGSSGLSISGPPSPGYNVPPSQRACPQITVSLVTYYVYERPIKGENIKEMRSFRSILWEVFVLVLKLRKWIELDWNY